ncbi:hypothetical protein P8C59_008751 [Phyllachora maydis]|uniref:Glycosyl hydrolase family 92 domain-containing protein n=1 Tax=Phyllachora maydis TaxID=1825666 RepID=A0AAD9MIS8_9PEZI|nr:hypothetical protein P8C59_008751 [Phyllachora maydis]
MISPQNYTGDNPLWDTGRPYFDSFYCLWDVFRTTQPMLSVLDPAAQSQMLNTLLDMYKHAGWLPDCHMPALSARRIRTYFPSAFNSSLSGLLGNDGGGAMGSFILFALLGLFPVAGQNVYLITPSFFREVNITNPVTGKTATVRNANFDPAAHANIYYVQNATLNGKPYTKSWIGPRVLLGGVHA